jgi:mono/diheme cytochrome c family protein
MRFSRIALILGASLAAASLGLWSVAAAGASGDAVALPDNPLQGRRLFEAKHCNQCHGIAGSGPSIGPSLGEGHFGGTFLDLGAALWNHVPGMSVTFEVTGIEWPQLSEQDLTELITFLNAIDYLGRPGVPAAGRRVFEAKGCDACHEVGRGGAGPGGDLADLRLHASPLFVAQEIWNHGPSMLQSMRELEMEPPSFAEGELADLSALIRQQAAPGPRAPRLLAPGNPNRGRELFRIKGCASCHGGDARGGDGGPNLAASDLHRSAEAIAGVMWNHALAMNSVMRERGIGWPRFEQAELADLVAFLYFLPFADPPGDPARGREVFAEQSCGKCHPAGRASIQPPPDVGPDLGGFGAGTPAALVAAMWSHAPMMKRVILRDGRPWPQVAGRDLRDLHAFLATHAMAP